MGDQSGPLSSPQQVLQGLARELKNPLLFIARQAEFSAKQSDQSGFLSIEQSAQEALQLIDSYLLSARSEYGQKQLDLEPINIGSILYDVAQNISGVAKKHNFEVQVSAGYSHPVMADKQVAISALSCLSQIILTPNDDNKARIIRLSSFQRSSGQVVAGVFATGSSGFTGVDIKKALNLQGNSQLALKGGATVSGVQLALAGNLANAMGGQVTPLKRFRTKGLGLEFIKSEQLVLV